MGGVPAETPMVSGAAPTKAPFIGCLRDVLIEKDIVDFNSVIYHTGVEMNTCSVETVESGTSLGSDVTTGMYLKVTPIFCFAFKIPDNVTASIMYVCKCIRM